jgi:hypothetical protein
MYYRLVSGGYRIIKYGLKQEQIIISEDINGIITIKNYNKYSCYKHITNKSLILLKSVNLNY